MSFGLFNSFPLSCPVLIYKEKGYQENFSSREPAHSSWLYFSETSALYLPDDRKDHKTSDNFLLHDRFRKMKDKNCYAVHNYVQSPCKLRFLCLTKEREEEEKKKI